MPVPVYWSGNRLSSHVGSQASRAFVSQKKRVWWAAGQASCDDAVVVMVCCEVRAWSVCMLDDGDHGSGWLDNTIHAQCITLYHQASAGAYHWIVPVAGYDIEGM